MINVLSKVLLASLVLAMWVVFSSTTSFAQSSSEPLNIKEDIKVIQRVIKIEGSIEKPRTIFILPRAKLWGGSVLEKSFRQEFLTPIFPAELTASTMNN
ncbi:MAG: hypothetical protein KAT46_02620 [Deltaproteobacteria bacterium]|nr:hypothetical protein [Deltaproteobacteria bacterium]